MHYLIDSCMMIWLLRDEKPISKLARDLFLDIDNKRYVSHASIWEIAIKDRKNPFGFKDNFERIIEKECYNRDIDLLAPELDDYFTAAALPAHHSDPFDRLLIAQAKNHKLTILTPDKYIKKYNVKQAW